MTLSGQQLHIRHGDQSATIVTVGGNLRAYRSGDRAVTETWPDDVLAPRGCGAALVPWPNRLRGGRYRFGSADLQLPLTEPAGGNAIHGLGRWARWTPLEHGESSVAIGIDIVPQTGYPFEVRVELTYTLATGGLTVQAAAWNTGSGPLPFGAGFHPYIHLGGHPIDDVQLTLPARRHLVVDHAQIPVGDEPTVGTAYDFRSPRVLGEQRLDDGFTDLERVDGQVAVSVRTPAGGGTVWFDESFGYTQVFTLADFEPGRPAVAVEPMTCPADAFNSGTGLVVLEPGQRWSGTWGITPSG